MATCPSNGVNGAVVANIDPSRLIMNLTDKPQKVPEPSEMAFGAHFTDHMIILSFAPGIGWSAPEIKPYGPISLDPSASCLQYATSLFEGMKAYRGPDGAPRLFRPQLNMRRMRRSAKRLALPDFDADALLVLIKKLVIIESRWIPDKPGYSLYIRPTMIGTRSHLGVEPSLNALLYVFCSPSCPFFGPSSVPGSGERKRITLAALHDPVRSWPRGTGSHKLSVNYAPTFASQTLASARGYDQVLWLLPAADSKNSDSCTITEAGAMNFFAIVQSAEDAQVQDVYTPPLDGTILPGITRASVLELLQAFDAGDKSAIPGLAGANIRIRVHETPLTIGDLRIASHAGRLRQVFCVGTAAIIAEVSRIGLNVKLSLDSGGSQVEHINKKVNGMSFPNGNETEDEIEEEVLELPDIPEGGISIAGALMERLAEIQSGSAEWENWSVPCSD